MAAQYSKEITDRFLNLYKIFEKIKTSNYGAYNFYDSKYHDLFELFRITRNNLSHNSYELEYTILVSDQLTLSLEKAIALMTGTMKNVMVKADKMYKASYGRTTMGNVIDAMAKRDFSLVPIVDETNHLKGVISKSSLIKILNDEKISAEDIKAKKIDEYKSYFSTDSQNEMYLFYGKLDFLYLAQDAFVSRRNDKKRVGAIFVTEHGKAEEALLGLITSYDAFKE